ncbi:ABC-2 family transporter protein [Staphylococcus cohnii]|uniref:ABC transporter permease n=1 Tax=Staphylococcus nepalensis TaxID=214473 RepID=UPI0018679E05
MIGQIIVTLSALLGVFFILNRFKTINNYSLSEIVLYFAITLLSFTIAETLFKGFEDLHHLILNGELDVYLLKPQHMLLQIIENNLDPTKIGRILQSLAMFIYFMNVSNIDFTFFNCIMLISMILSGTVIFSCLYIIYGGLCFFTLNKIELFTILTQGSREFGKYPIDVYGEFVLKFSTYMVPYALAQYYPFLYLVGKSENTFYIIYPFISLLFVIPTAIIWNLGLSNYESSGS